MPLQPCGMGSRGARGVGHPLSPAGPPQPLHEHLRPLLLSPRRRRRKRPQQGVAAAARRRRGGALGLAAGWGRQRGQRLDARQVLGP
jgi:hypothetical protein